MAKTKELTLEEKLKEALIPKEEQPYEIPKNWEWVKLGSIAIFSGGSGFPEEYQGYLDKNIPFYKVGNLKDAKADGSIFKSNNYIDEKIVKIIKAKIFPKNTIIFAKIGEAIKLNRRAILTAEACIDNNLMSMQTREALYYKYVYYWTKKEDFYKYTQATTVPSIRQTSFENLSFSLPPLEEQKRIVEKLDSMFEKINKTKELIQEGKENIESRKESILNKAFRGELTVEWRKNNQTEDAIELLKSINEEKIKNWEQECIEAEKNGKKKPSKPKIEEIENMIISKEEEPYEIPKNWKWTKLGNITNYGNVQQIKPENIRGDAWILELEDIEKNTFRLLKKYSKEIRKSKSSKNIFNKGDILYSKLRPYLKKIIISEDAGYCTTEIVPFKGLKNISNKYIFFIMNIPNTVNYINKSTHGMDMPRLGTDAAKNIFVPLPPLEEQQEIVRILDEILEKESKIKELIELEEAIELLEKSILDKAFRGKLGTQNKDDEPAIELLKKIL